MTSDPFEQVRQAADPVVRAKEATQLLAVYQQRIVELGRLRREALDELQARGVSYAEVAAKVGLSKARVGQIKLAAPKAARALFGVGPVEVWTPARSLGRSLPVVATEDALTAQELTRLLDAFAFQSTQRHVPGGDHEWSPEGDCIVICGPKTNPRAARWIGENPVLDLTRRPDGWVVIERASAAVHASPMDAQPATPEDVAYVSRVRTASGVRWHVAGIHAIGSLGAATFLTENIESLWAAHGDTDYSLVVASTHDGATITSARALVPVLPHEH